MADTNSFLPLRILKQWVLIQDVQCINKVYIYIYRVYIYICMHMYIYIYVGTGTLISFRGAARLLRLSLRRGRFRGEP